MSTAEDAITKFLGMQGWRLGVEAQNQKTVSTSVNQQAPLNAMKSRKTIDFLQQFAAACF